jgi:hypothetical protein
MDPGVVYELLQEYPSCNGPCLPCPGVLDICYVALEQISASQALYLCNTLSAFLIMYFLSVPASCTLYLGNYTGLLALPLSKLL